MNIFQIDKVAYNSKIYNASPAVKIAAGFIPLMMCIIFSKNYVSVSVLFLMTISAVYYSGLKITSYVKLMSVPFVFIFIGVITVALTKVNNGNGFVVFTLFSKDMGFTEYSISQGLVIFLKSLAAVSCTYFISLNTTMPDIAYLLKKCRIPPLIISLIELIYRYIFLLLEEGAKIKTAQTSRLGYHGIKSSLSSAGELAGSLLIRTLSKSDRVYASLVSRGYDGYLPVLKREYSTGYGLVIFSVFTSLAVALAGFLL